MTRPHLDNFAKSMIATGALVLPVALLAPAAAAAPALAKGCKAHKIASLTWHEGQSKRVLSNGYFYLVVVRDRTGAHPYNAYKANKQSHWTTLTVVLQDGTVKVSRYHHGGGQGGTLTNLVVKATLEGVGCGPKGF